MAQTHSRNPNDPNAHKPDQTLTASWIESHLSFSWISSLEPSLSRPSPSTSSPHPFLSILNPNISLTSLIGLRASPSVPHGLPPQLCVILILPLMPNTYLRGCASLCHHLSHFPHCKSYFFVFAYLLLQIVLLWPYNVDCCLKCYIS